MVYKGEDVTDAVVKTDGHLGAGLAGAEVGTLIGSAMPVGGTALGFVVGGVIGVVGSAGFDWIYENSGKILDNMVNIKEKDAGAKIGEAVSGFFGGLGLVFG